MSSETFTPECLETLRNELEQKFSAAGILNIGGRVALLLDDSNEEQLGRFLKANPGLTVAMLQALWTHLGEPNSQGIPAKPISTTAVVPIKVGRI